MKNEILIPQLQKILPLMLNNYVFGLAGETLLLCAPYENQRWKVFEIEASGTVSIMNDDDELIYDINPFDLIVQDLTEATQNKAITGDLFPNYTIYPLNVNGKVLQTQIHKHNQMKGSDYPGVELLEEIVSLNLPLYGQQDLITNVFFYHRCVFVTYTRYGRPDFTVFYEGKTTRFKTLDLIHKFIDTHIV